MRDTLGKVLRVVAILLMALTGAMNVLGGAGTSCAAFATANFPPFRSIMDYAWLYQGFVIVTVALGLAGIWVTYRLIRAKPEAYRHTLIVLAAGSVVAVGHFLASTALRGKAVPANMKMYINLFTLVVFLILGLPGVRDRVNFGGSQDGGRSAAAGLAALMMGLLTLSTPMWAASSHTFGGVNLALTFPVALLLPGVLLSLAGVGLLAWSLAQSAPPSQSWSQEGHTVS